MKKIITLSLLALSFTLITTSCEKGFDELNTIKTAPTNIDPAFTLNAAVINTSVPGGTLQYDLGIVQQIISSNSGIIAGANYNQVNPGNTPAIWIQYYQNVIKYTNDVIVKTATITPARPNLTAMARIMQANAFMILTDTYGDIPYTEAGKGFTSQLFYPKYDAQSAIYPQIIQELTDAVTALDPAARIETADVLYGGSVDKWKKYGRSLLLRAGMRIVKRDAVNGKAAINSAFSAGAAGLVTTNADLAYIRHDANFVNAVGNTLNSTEAANYYMAAPFVNILLANKDPRINSIAVRYVGATSGPEQVAAKADTTAAKQVGIPMGVDDLTAGQAATTAGIGSRYAFTQIDRTRLSGRLQPMFLLTAAETNLLLSEASLAVNNFIPGGDVAALTYFTTGIKAHMDQLALYGAGTIVPASYQTTYINRRSVLFAAATPADKTKEINTEYWIASFLNGPETWANFRRSNYPVLAPNPYPGRTVNFITRLTYPPSEILVNKNVQSAISNMGGDALDVKVWWDID